MSAITVGPVVIIVIIFAVIVIKSFEIHLTIIENHYRSNPERSPRRQEADPERCSWVFRFVGRNTPTLEDAEKGKDREAKP